MNILLLLSFSRALGFSLKAPVLGHPSTPHQVRVIFAAILAVAVSPLMTNHQKLSGAILALACLSEALIGMLLGSGSAVLYDAAYAGGRVLDDYLGVRTAMPMATVASGAEFGRLWSLVLLSGCVLLGGLRTNYPRFLLRVL